MRLSALVPALPADVVAALGKCAIKTDGDLLFSGAAVDIFHRLPPGTVTLNDLHGYIALVANAASAPGICAVDLFPLKAPSLDAILSGVPALDALLGGFGGPRVLEVAGDKGSGKTALALHLVLRHLAAHADAGALWIDSTGDFAIARAVRAATAHAGEAAATMLDRLHVSIALDVVVAHNVLDALRAQLDARASDAPIRCIVIDTITPLFSPLLSAVSAQGHAMMTDFMRRLRALAQSYDLTILVLNNATSAKPRNALSAFSATVKKPALGPSFAFLTDATLWLATYGAPADTQGSAVHVAEVFRSRASLSKTWCFFGIERSGLITSIDGASTL